MTIQKIGVNLGYPKKADLDKLISKKNLSTEDLKKSLEDVAKQIEEKSQVAHAVANVAAAGLGVGTALAAAKLYSAKTGKPAGVIASPAHVFSNDKLDSKAATYGEMLKESTKDTVTLAGTTVGVAAASSLAVANSNKVANSFRDLISKTAEKLSKVSVDGKDLKTMIKDTNSFKKFNSLPIATKAGLLAGAAALAVLTPIYIHYSSTKMGYIEGKHEVQ